VCSGQEGQSEKQLEEKSQKIDFASQAGEPEIDGNMRKGQLENVSVDEAQKIHIADQASETETVTNADMIKKASVNGDISREAQAFDAQSNLSDEYLGFGHSFDEVDTDQFGFHFGPSSLSSNTNNVANTPANSMKKPFGTSQLSCHTATAYHHITPISTVRDGKDSQKESEKFLGSIVSSGAKSVRVVVGGEDLSENNRVLPFEIPTPSVNDTFQEGLMKHTDMHPTPCRLDDSKLSAGADNQDISSPNMNMQTVTAGKTDRIPETPAKLMNDTQTSGILNTESGKIDSIPDTPAAVAGKTDRGLDASARLTNDMQASAVSNTVARKTNSTLETLAGPTNDAQTSNIVAGNAAQSLGKSTGLIDGMQSKKSEDSKAKSKNSLSSFFLSFFTDN
jgi:hypothetical protein